ncbi:MAG TPA: tetratricopeptide repeat protein [Stellaceae bacterium]|nr:tetratricopeptide repeat protein [Stellaceae bacterium]
MRCLLAFLLILLTAGPAAADFAAAKKAQALGDFAGALAACKPDMSAGDANCQNLVGDFYAKGLGVVRDPKKAFDLFRRAARQGLAAAQNNLGRLYQVGEGVPKDAAKAAGWYKRAAAAGNMVAQNNLGILYAKGEGVPRNAKTALSLFHSAAVKGYPNAQLNLGLLLQRRNPVGAFEWFTIAARPTTPEALRNRAAEAARRVAARLPPAELAAAKKRGAAWQPKKP